MLAGALADPAVSLHDTNGMLIASNDNWKTRSDGPASRPMRRTALCARERLGISAPSNLAPGSYTVIVRGTNNTTGVGLVEAYICQ